MKNKMIMLTILVLLIPLVNAQTVFDVDKSYNWLISQQKQDGSFNNNVFETSLAILALKKAGLESGTEKAADWLEIQKDIEGCFPVGSCQIKDTSFALLALNAMGRDITTTSNWLKDAQTPTASQNQWFIQIYPNSDGLCEIKHSENGQLKTTQFSIQDNKIPECNNEPWFDLVSCIPSNPLNANPSTSFEIDCSKLSGSVTILLINKIGSSYFLVEKQPQSKATISVDSGCWGQTKGNSCGVETSLYANWALIETGKLPEVLTWPKSNRQNTNRIHNSLLYFLEGKQKYLDSLKTTQSQSGSWNENIYETSLAVLSSKNTLDGTLTAQNGIEWLKTKQNQDGSFGSIRDTAITLYSAFSDLDVNCGDNFCDQGETVTCPSDCPATNQQIGNIENICNDSLDNDNDGFTDCSDFDCSQKPECIGRGETICNNNIDDDNDGSTDCDDLDCQNNILCKKTQTKEICDNGIDDDGNRLIDCNDSQCFFDITCEKTEICDNNIDDDNDGDIDEDDLDCIGSKKPKKEGGGFLFWFILFIIILSFVVGLFYLYKKRPDLFKKKPKEPQQNQQNQQRVTQPYYQKQQYAPQKKPNYRRKEEDQLSKSIRDFKKEIGKK